MTIAANVWLMKCHLSEPCRCKLAMMKKSKSQNKQIVLAIALLLLAASCPAGRASKSPARGAQHKAAIGKKAKKPSPDQMALEKSALTAFQTGRYGEAEKLFKEAEKENGGDVSVQYYLAISALYAGDMKEAEMALCRVIIMADPESEFGVNARQTLKNYSRQFGVEHPYTQRDPLGILRWDTKKYPIKIWVSNGLVLPKGYIGPQLTGDNVHDLYPMLSTNSFYARLATVEHYVPTYRDVVKQGINDWNFLCAEGLVKFEIVEDPTIADVLIFWCPESGAGSVGRTYYPDLRYEGCRAIIHIETEYMRIWGARATMELRHTAAHEFGHVLGITIHSHDVDDLMHDAGKTISWEESKQYSAASPITRNDYVTLRAIYQLPADQLFEPIPVKSSPAGK